MHMLTYMICRPFKSYHTYCLCFHMNCLHKIYSPIWHAFLTLCPIIMHYACAHFWSPSNVRASLEIELTLLQNMFSKKPLNAENNSVFLLTNIYQTVFAYQMYFWLDFRLKFTLHVWNTSSDPQRQSNFLK